MAEPAREDAPAPARRETREPGPAAPRWAPVWNLLAGAAEAARAAAADLAAHPDCPTAQLRIELICDALVNLTAITSDLAELDRGRVVDEAVMAAREQAAYNRGLADGRTRRRSLEVIPGG